MAWLTGKSKHTNAHMNMIVVVDGGGGGGNSTNTANSGAKKSIAKNLSGIALSICFYNTKQP